MINIKKYPLVFEEEDDGTFSVHVDGMPGCVAQGETLQGAYEAIRSVQPVWVETCEESKCPVPDPPRMSINMLRAKYEFLLNEEEMLRGMLEEDREATDCFVRALAKKLGCKEDFNLILEELEDEQQAHFVLAQRYHLALRLLRQAREDLHGERDCAGCDDKLYIRTDYCLKCGELYCEECSKHFTEWWGERGWCDPCVERYKKKAEDLKVSLEYERMMEERDDN